MKTIFQCLKNHKLVPQQELHISALEAVEQESQALLKAERNVDAPLENF